MKNRNLVLSKGCSPVVLFWLFIFSSISIPMMVQAEIKDLQNDSFDESGTVVYQGGFVTGEMMAARFTPDPDDYPIHIRKIKVYVETSPGGQTSGQFVLHLWADNGNLQPGPELIDPYPYTLSASGMNIINLQSQGIMVNSGSVRVGLQFAGNPPPSFCNDNDGNITPQKNFIFAYPPSGDPFWAYSESFGVNGDWILRLEINASDCIHDGDATLDGVVTMNDAQLAFGFVLGVYSPTSVQYCAADCNGDNELTSADVQGIFGTAIGLGTCQDPI